MNRRNTLALLLLFILLIATGCSPEQPALSSAPDNVVRIVSSLPTRGASAGQSKSISDAIRKAIEERGGVAGKWRVQYVPLAGGSDETGEWSRNSEIANAAAAAADPSVVAYIGPYNSGAAEVSLPITSRAGLVEASPSATWPGLTMAGWDKGEPEKYYPTGTHNFIRLMPPDAVQAQAAAQWASDSHFTSVYVLDDGSSYSSGMADAFTRHAELAGIKTRGRLQVQPPRLDVLAQQIGSAQGVFYAPSTVNNAVAVAKALEGQGSVVLATDTALSSQFADQAGSSAKSWLVVSNSAPPEVSGKYAPPGGATTSEGFDTQFAANAYAMTNLILDSVASGAGRDRAALLKSMHDYHGTGDAGSRALFSPTGDPTDWVVSGYQWRGDRFAYVRKFDASH